MKNKTRGIILQTTDYSESSLVVKIYTEDEGLGSFIVSGVRSKNGRFKASTFQPLSLVELISTGKTGTTLKRITDIQLSPAFTDIPVDMIKSSIAMFLAEVIYKSVKEEAPNPELFNFLHNAIQVLDITQQECSRFHLYFMVQFTKYLGCYPNGDYAGTQSVFDLREGLYGNSIPNHMEYMPSKPTAHLHQLMNSTFETYHLHSITNADRQELLYALVNYYEMHQTHGSTIKSHKVLEEVLH